MTGLDRKDPRQPIDSGFPASAPSPSGAFLVGMLGGLSLGALVILGLQASGSVPPLPEDATAARVFSRIPDRRSPGAQEATPTVELARYYALSRQARPVDPPGPLPLHVPSMGGNRPAQAIVSPAPAYPVLAGRVGLQGAVDVTVLVDEHGLPADVSSGGGSLVLQKAALDAAAGWRFRPATENGKPVPALFTIHFDFKLPERAVRL